MRISLIAFASLLLLAIAAVFVGIQLLRSDWFFQQVRQRIIAEAEKATGGKVELRQLHFDWTTLTAEADGFVIHGTEPAGEAPLFRAAKIVIGLKLISLPKKQVDVASIAVTDPETNLLIAADGTTNIPQPKTPPSGTRIDQTILDLAIGKFSAQNGIIQIKAAGEPPKKLPWSLRGEKLKAILNYSSAGPSYSGNLSLDPLHASYSGYGPVDAAVDLAVKLERDHIQVTAGKLRTASSQIEFSGDLRNLTAPVVTGHYTAHVSAQEAGRLLAWRTTQSGAIETSGEFRFDRAGDFLVQGKLQAAELTYRDPDLHFDHVRIRSNFYADAHKVELTNMSAFLLGGNVQAQVTVTNGQRFAIKGTLVGFGATALANLLQTTPPPLDALVSGPFEAQGTFAGLKDRRVNASAQITLGPVGSSPLNGLLDVQYDGTQQYVDFRQSFVALPSTRVDFSGGLSVRTGAYNMLLQVRVATTNLNDALIIAPAIKELPVTLANGHAGFSGSLSGPPSSPVIAGHLTANNIVIEKQSIEAFSADVNASSSQVQVRNGTLAYQNMRARLAGTLALREWKPDNQSAVTATASLQNADIANLLALAGQTQIPVKGALSANAQVNGTLADPRATATLRGGKGSAYGEPFDHLTADLTYVNGGRQEFTAEVDSGAKKVNLTGAFQHAPDDFLAGTVQATVKTTDIPLNQIQAIRQYQPDIAGIAQATADAQLRIQHLKAGEQFAILSLNADVVTHNLALDQKQLGDLHLVAHTAPGRNPPALPGQNPPALPGQNPPVLPGQSPPVSPGQNPPVSPGQNPPPVLNVQLDSNVAHSTIHGNGSWSLTGDYPGQGDVTFNQVNLAEVRRIFAPHATSLTSIGGSVEGRITFRGPAEKPRTMTGALEIPKLEIKPEPGGAIPIPESLRNLVIRNQGPIRAAMANGVIRVESARVMASSTDVSLAGTINLNAQSPLNLRASGNLDLAILPIFERDLISSGAVVASATITGPFAQPSLLGRLEVKNANLSLEGLPNGLSNANGTVIFDPSRATIQSLTAETGGGKVNLTGFASFSNGPMALGLQADAHDVRLRYPEGVSTVANASLRLVGTEDRSTLSGTITIVRSSFTPHTDLGRLLANAAAPVETPSVQTGFVGNMQFDVDIVTAPDVTFQTSLAQGLQADANLRLRGTISNPVMIGRINVNQGDLMFFGNKYSINQGTVSFFNPVKLEPVLNISLETRARGVDITINVTGPITKLNVSYRSDPPLQLSDLVALLATGRTPENPTLAMQDTGTPQTWQEMGASALLGQAIANPLAGRLQRFFGVSKIKIDPLLTGVAGNAQARLTIEQNVTPDLIFTYITNVNSSTGSAQVIRVEWDFSRHWSAVAVRDEYGYFGIDFQYRTRLK